MCISAAVIAGATLIAGGAAAYTSISAANNNARLAGYENAVRTKQLNEKRRLERLAAIEGENARSAEFAQMRSSALAAIGASGLGENISFFQAIDPEQQRAFLRDVRNIRLNLTAEESGIRDQIQVGAFGERVSRANAGAAKMGAIASFAQTAMSAATFYQTYTTPPAAAAT